MQGESSEFFEIESVGDGRSGIFTDNYILGERIYLSDTGFAQLNMIRRSGRLFVAKSLRPEYRNDDVAKAALRKEYQIGFRIDIPGAIRTYDFSFLPEIGEFIALEYCHGEDLRHLIDSGNEISGETLMKITHSLIQTVKAIHNEGIIHRDIKPSNIIYDNLSRSCKLIDFGCADAIDQTMFKGRAGTDLYQSEGFTNTVANDWYALSLTLSELSGLCADRNVVRKVGDICRGMRLGIPPEEKEKRKNPYVILAVIAAVAIIIGGFYLFYSLPREEDEMPKVAGRTEVSDSIDTVSPSVPAAETIAGDSIKDIRDLIIDTKGEQSTASLPAEEKSVGDDRKKTLPQDRAGENDRLTEAVVDKTEESRIVGISETSLGYLHNRLNMAARDVLRDRERELEDRKQKVYYSWEARMIERQLFGEETCVNAMIALVGNIPIDAPMDSVREIAGKYYRSVIRSRHNVF